MMGEFIEAVRYAWSRGGSLRVSAIFLVVLPVCIIINVLHLISIFWPKSKKSRYHAPQLDGKEFKEGK